MGIMPTRRSPLVSGPGEFWHPTSVAARATCRTAPAPRRAALSGDDDRACDDRLVGRPRRGTRPGATTDASTAMRRRSVGSAASRRGFALPVSRSAASTVAVSAPVATWAVGAVDGDDGPAPGSPWQSRGLPAGGARRPRRPGWRQPANELWSDGQPAVTLWPGQRDHRRHRATRPARGRVPYERTVVADLKVGPSKPAVPWPVSHRRMTRRR
jgi:hypothetical protein